MHCSKCGWVILWRDDGKVVCGCLRPRDSARPGSIPFGKETSSDEPPTDDENAEKDAHAEEVS